MGKVGCLVKLAAILVGFLEVSILKFYIAGVMKKKSTTPGFGLQVMPGGSLCV